MAIGKLSSLAAAALLSGTISAFAMASWFPTTGNHDSKPPQSHSAAGPIVGTGIPLALLLGGYFWYRGRAKR